MKEREVEGARARAAAMRSRSHLRRGSRDSTSATRPGQQRHTPPAPPQMRRCAGPLDPHAAAEAGQAASELGPATGTVLLAVFQPSSGPGPAVVTRKSRLLPAAPAREAGRGEAGVRVRGAARQRRAPQPPPPLRPDSPHGAVKVAGQLAATARRSEAPRSTRLGLRGRAGASGTQCRGEEQNCGRVSAPSMTAGCCKAACAAAHQLLSVAPAKATAPPVAVSRARRRVGKDTWRAGGHAAQPHRHALRP